ncbi:MAG: FAD-binding protein [Rhodobacteraceae bacterium]|nr:FAD-binding protein [Paracoccaceae bacterium]
MSIPKPIEYFLTHYREIVIAGFAVPASFIHGVLYGLNNWVYRTFRNTSVSHDKAVKLIQDEVRAGWQNGQQMCTGRKPWKSMSSRSADFKASMHQVSIDHLRNVLEVDEVRHVVRAEPMVTMGDITHFLVPKGFALAVQAEMDDLTLGGLCMGVGIETSSHREGFLFETVEAFEIVIANGDCLRCTREDNSELFYALPWSHGTLGFLVAVELRIVPIKSHIRLEYEPCHSLKAFCSRLEELTASSDAPQFIEGLIFSSTSGVILKGDFAVPPRHARVNRINNFYKPWFFSHVARSLTEVGPFSEYVPTRHYFHRHTPSIFFQIKDLIRFANTVWYRYLWAWMGAPKISLMKLTMTQDVRRQVFEGRVAQDILIPIEHLAESVLLSADLFEIYPLWVCPVRLFDHDIHEGFLRNPANGGGGSQMFVDLGIYGIPATVKTGNYNQIQATRKLEAFVRDRGGYQMLYADICMTQSEFEDMFEHRLYRAMRERYAADRVFPDVYSKVRPESWIREQIEASTDITFGRSE